MEQKKLLELLDQLLYAAFLLKKEKDFENLSMRGLVITEKEIDQAFGRLHQESRLPEEVLEMLAERQSEIGLWEQSEEGTLPFFRLCGMFGLTELERLALLLAAAPCFDRKYERIYGYLQDHVENKDPSRGLCVSLAEFFGEIDPGELADFLAAAGNLEYLMEKGDRAGSGLSGACRLKPRVGEYLQGSGELSKTLKGKCEFFPWTEGAGPMEIRRKELERLCRLWDGLEKERWDGQKKNAPGDSCMIFLHGREGIGKRFLLRHLAVERKRNLLFLDLSDMLYGKPETAREILEDLLVETHLQHAEAVLYHGDLLREPEEEERQSRQDVRRGILAYMEEHFLLFFLLCREKEEQTGDFAGRKLCVELPALTAGERIVLWKKWGAEYPLAEDVDPELSGNKYILTPKGIRDVLDTAQLLSQTEGGERIRQEHIRRAVQSNQPNQLGAYATLINSRFAWDDLILGEEAKQQMRMVCDQMRYRDVVGEQWGFHQKTPYGRGLSVLFYGPPGTGKTMAAQVIANELGLDLYRIDISQMVSKYIGETQKNISRLFQKAKDINAVLFFDEADSLFAKRSEAKDSHDRNANAETAHLLQKLEDYEGITVLATNYLNNIDDAFKRRIKFIIHIAFPESQVRLRLWRSTLPAEAKCEEELDFEFFAEHFELSGSSIKEILTNAAYLAASKRRGMKNCDLVEAVKLNYAKYGKILTKNDFGYLG